METESYNSIGQALTALNELIQHKEQDAIRYKRRIAANEDSWQRKQVYLRDKLNEVEILQSIHQTLELLKQPDQWYCVQSSIEHIQRKDPGITAAQILLPLKAEIDMARLIFLDLSKLSSHV